MSVRGPMENLREGSVILEPERETRVHAWVCVLSCYSLACVR